MNKNGITLYNFSDITSLDVKQVAYPVGICKDSYYHYTYFKQSVETNEISVEHKVYKNYYRGSKSELLFTGTAKECQQFIVDLVNKVETEEGYWKRNEHNLNEEFILVKN